MGTRASTTTVPPYPDAPYTFLYRFLHRKFPEFAAKMAKNSEADIMAINGPDLYDDKIFIPKDSLIHDNNIRVLPTDFIQLKKEGRIIGKLASIDEIVNETTVRLDSGEELQADMIIGATGFLRRFPFFSEKHAQMMGLIIKSNGDTTTNLYRRVLPVGIPNIGFIGFTSSTNHWMIAEMASHWLSDYFLKTTEITI